jgi:para-nitrobenzyl esterase
MVHFGGIQFQFRYVKGFKLLNLRALRLYGGLFILCVISMFLVACPKLEPNVSLSRGMVYGYGYTYDEQDAAYVMKELYFDLMEPTDSPLEKRPALVMVHGGSFTGGSREDEDLFALANKLASAGYVCFLIDYRLMADQPPAPPPYDATELEATVHASTVDVKAAIRHVRANAATYAVNPDRIAITGDSAGAITAMAAGVSDQGQYSSDGEAFPVPDSNAPGVDESVVAIVDLWGTADSFLDDFDPTDPPIMIVHGAKDFTVGISLMPAQNIVEQCEAYGIPYRYYPVLDAGHGVWDIEVGDKDLARLIFDFLQEFMVK